jgi:hypothetical protein
MHLKSLSVLLAALALSACENPAAYHDGEAERRAMAPLPQPVKMVADTGFCRNVAHQDSDSNFDAQTQERLYEASFRQCMAIYGPPDLRLADLDTSDAGY